MSRVSAVFMEDVILGPRAEDLTTVPLEVDRYSGQARE